MRQLSIKPNRNPDPPSRVQGGAPRWRLTSWLAFALAALAALAFFGVWQAYVGLRPGEPYVDLAGAKSLETSPPSGESGDKALRIAVATMWSVESTFAMYDQIVRAISERVGRESSFVLRSSYRQLLRAMSQGEVDVAFVCTGPFVESQRHFKLLVQPVFADGLEYYSAVIVPAGSDAESLDDLRGRAIGFSDPYSFTGRLVPGSHLVETGRTPEDFFGNIIYTGSHERSIRAVDAGIVDAAAVHSIVLASALKHDPGLDQRIRPIWRSPAYGPPPVVVPRDIAPEAEAELKRAFLDLDGDEEGKGILASLGLVRFVEAEEEEYRSAIDLFERIRTHPEMKTWVSNADR